MTRDKEMEAFAKSVKAMAKVEGFSFALIVCGGGDDGQPGFIGELTEDCSLDMARIAAILNGELEVCDD